MSEKIVGVDVLLEVNIGTADIPVMKKLGGQRGATLNRTKETIESTTKDSNGWREYKSGFKEWSLDCDGTVVVNDEAYDMLEDAFDDKTPIQARVLMPSGKEYSGDVLITDFPIELPYDDLVTYSLSLTGSGQLKKI